MAHKTLRLACTSSIGVALLAGSAIGVSATASAAPSPHFTSCDQAKAAGYVNIHRGQPGYSAALDHDHDGIACEADTPTGGNTHSTTPAPVKTTPAPVKTTPAPVKTTPTPSPAKPAPSKSSSAPVTGNLQHTTMKFWCAKGIPDYLVAVRTVKVPEASVTVTETQLGETHTLGPVTHTQPVVFFSKINQAGKKVTLLIKGNTTGSTFTVSGTVPATCAGLPNVAPDGSVTKPAVPAKNALPIKPVTKPAGTTPTAPAKPVAPVGKPTTAPTIGPKVQTDLVAPASSNNVVGEAGLLAAGALVLCAGVAARRRNN